MSSSSEPWEIPPQWCWSTFADAAEIAQDLVDPALVPDMPHIAPNNIGVANRQLLPYTTVKEDGVISPKQRFRANQILFTKIRPYLLKSVKVDFDGVCSADMYPLWARQVVDPDYLLYWLTSPDFRDVIAHSQGRSVLPKINQFDLNATPFPIPPKSEQRRIVDKIDSLSAKSKCARGRLEHLLKLVENYKQSILDAAFKGKLVPGTSSARLLPISQLIDRLDQGWSPKCEPEPAAIDSDWAVMKTTAVQPIDFRSGENKRLPASLQPRPELEIRPGDVIITRAGPRSRVAITCIVRATRPRLMLCDKAYRMRTAADRVDSNYIAYMLNAPSMVEQLEQLKTGISDSGLNLTQSKFLALELPCPPLELQREIVRRLDVAFSWIDRLAAEASNARKLIDHLDQAVLSKAFQGKLVPQDPANEPASSVLKRIKPASGGMTSVRKRRGHPRLAIAP